MSVFGATGCTVDEIRCDRSRDFTVDAELSKADVDRLCELRGGFFYEEYVCPGETPPATGEYETYVPECEELCWARQQRFVEEYGTGSLGFPPESVEPPNFEDYDDFFGSSGDGIRRVVATCTTNVHLDAPLAETGSIGRIRCSGIEMAACSYDYY